MRDRLLTSSLIACAALGLSATTLSGDVAAAEPVRVLIFMENGIGTSSQAQKYVDKLVETAAAENGWSGGEGKYVTQRKSAESYVSGKKPSYGFLSLGPYLAWRKSHSLEVLGVADVDRAGGRRYHLVSKTASALSGCKGQKVASNHAEDAAFINKVVAGGSFTLGDFQLVTTRRPVQTLKAVIKGEAACALIDDAQLRELPHIDGSAGVKSVWKSEELPPMPVVAFSGTSSAERAKFKASLGSLCAGAGKQTCDKVGIRSISAADESRFAKVIKAYGG